MAVKGYFYNSVNRDRLYNGEDMNEDKAPFYKEGVAYGHLVVTAGEGMMVKVDGGNRTGYAYINMHTIHNTTVLELHVSQASGNLPRIDRVVIRNDETERKPSIFILEGAYSSNPQPPDLTYTDVIQEKCLAEIYVAAGAVEITQADITDTRADPNLCGFIASQFVDFDFSQLTLQFDAWFKQEKESIESDHVRFIEEYERLTQAFMEGQAEEFVRWFELIKDTLKDDPAGELFKKIEEHKTSGDHDDRYYTKKEIDEKDISNNTVEFESGDDADPKEYTEVEVIKSGDLFKSILTRFTTTVKNVRYIWRMLGQTDISKIGDGTVTGAIGALNDNLPKIVPLWELGNTDISSGLPEMTVELSEDITNFDYFFIEYYIDIQKYRRSSSGLISASLDRVTILFPWSVISFRDLIFNDAKHVLIYNCQLFMTYGATSTSGTDNKRLIPFRINGVRVKP